MPVVGVMVTGRPPGAILALLPLFSVSVVVACFGQAALRSAVAFLACWALALRSLATLTRALFASASKALTFVTGDLGTSGRPRPSCSAASATWASPVGTISASATACASSRPLPCWPAPSRRLEVPMPKTMLLAPPSPYEGSPSRSAPPRVPSLDVVGADAGVRPSPFVRQSPTVVSLICSGVVIAPAHRRASRTRAGR